MKKVTLFFICALLGLGGNSYAADPCYPGEPVHLNFALYCAEDVGAAYQLAYIQRAIYIQQFGSAAMRVVSEGPSGNQYCISVQFFRCTRRKADTDVGVDLGGAQKMSQLDQMIAQLEQDGFFVNDVYSSKTDSSRLLVSDKAGDRYVLVVDKFGEVLSLAQEPK